MKLMSKLAHMVNIPKIRFVLLCSWKELAHFSLHQIFRWSNQEEWDGLSVWHVWGKGGVHTRFWWRNLMERELLGDPGVDGRIILR